MHARPETLYAPMLDPADPASAPTRPSGRRYVPLRPDRRGRTVGRRWLRRLDQESPLWGHTCVSDVTLRRLERTDPLGLALAEDAGVRGVVSMDVPLYAFMAPAQVERARALRLHRLLRSVEEGPRRGLEIIPLIKALDAVDLSNQLDLAVELGLPRVALYARELLLERDETILRRFVRGAHARRLVPLLLGACTPRALAWGPAELAGAHHYVLARRGLMLDPRGRRRRVHEASYSEVTRRFLVPGDHGALADHNYERLAQRLTTGPAPFAG